MKTIRRTEFLTKLVLTLWFIAAMYFQHNLGLADNGDFTRVMNWISSGPVGIEPNWPAADTEDWSKRFFNYWIPYWKLEWNLSGPTTSAVLLWLPGALLNDFLYSSKILYLPALSFFPKLILLGVLLFLFKWIDLQPRCRLGFLFGLALPVTLLLTTTDYVAYFNSFYQESASLVYLLLLLASILLLRRRPSPPYLLCSLTAILLLATSKTSNLYWPLVAIPFVLSVWNTKKNVRLPTAVATSSALILILTLAAAFMTKAGSIQDNRYHSLFYGALTFSDNPSAHLQQLGMGDAARCVGTDAYGPTGIECIGRYQSQLSFKNTLRVVFREPVVMFRMLNYVLDTMQDISLDYLGKYSFNDPRAQTSPRVGSNTVEARHFVEQKRFWLSTTETIPLNLWASLKFTFFPTGYTLALVLIVFVGWFVLSAKWTGVYQDLSLVGLLVTIACVADMTVAILGDGKYELVKHLFLSNVLFDVAVIVFLNSMLVFLFSLVRIYSQSTQIKMHVGGQWCTGNLSR